MEPQGTRRCTVSGALIAVYHESADERRRRVYRNHVRKLLRGRRWYEAELSRLRAEDEHWSLWAISTRALAASRMALARLGAQLELLRREKLAPLCVRLRREMCERMSSCRMPRRRGVVDPLLPNDKARDGPNTCNGSDTGTDRRRAAGEAASCCATPTRRLTSAGAPATTAAVADEAWPTLQLEAASTERALGLQPTPTSTRAAVVATAICTTATAVAGAAMLRLRRSRALRRAHSSLRHVARGTCKYVSHRIAEGFEAAEEDRRRPLLADAVFYPQKMLMARALSCWITFCLALCLQNAKLWLHACLRSAHRLEATLNRQAGLTDQLEEATLLNR